MGGASALMGGGGKKPLEGEAPILLWHLPPSPPQPPTWETQ